MVIDYKKCISCFCCQELCTTEAITVQHPMVGRFLAKITR